MLPSCTCSSFWPTNMFQELGQSLTCWPDLEKLGHVLNSNTYTPCPEKNAPPPKHIQITLWIENDSHYFSLYHEKPSICNVCVKFHDNQSVHCWDIAFYKKMIENCRRQHCQLTHAVMLNYARQYWCQRTVRQRLRNFCINKNKMVA